MAANGQDIKLKTKDNDSEYEEYYVLAKDKKIKHGSYLRITRPNLGVWGGNFLAETGTYDNGNKQGIWETYYFNNNQIKSKGKYDKGQKDGLWYFYYSEPGEKELRQVQTEQGAQLEIVNLNTKISSKGNYKQGKRVGIWEFYDFDQNLIEKFDYDLFKPNFHFDYPNLDNKPASFIGGDYEFISTSLESFDFRSILIKIQNTSGLKIGDIQISFTIDKNGNISDLVTEKDEIKNKKILSRSIEVVNSLSGKWTPEYKDGIPMISRKSIVFELRKETSTNAIVKEGNALAKRTMGAGYVLTTNIKSVP